MPLFESMRGLGQSSTELKVRQATDENEKAGATGTLMNEISVLTYSVKTVREITQVLKKRLTAYSRRTSHKSSVHIIKTLTLVLYLINNGSDEFIAWVRGNISFIECFQDYEALETRDQPLENQIRSMSRQICDCINDDELLERKRKEVVEFRSSISSPGRKSTDNSHLRRMGFPRGSLEHTPSKPSGQMEENMTSLSDYQYASNPNIYYGRSTTSLHLRRRAKGMGNQVSVLRLDPLEEESEIKSIRAES